MGRDGKNIKQLLKMKNLFALLTILTMMAMASCSDYSSSAEALPTSGNAALDLYYRYADNENLTVAYLGDFSLSGNKIDALMIQVNLEEDWSQLMQEFGMHSGQDSLRVANDSDFSALPENQKPVSVGVEISADFVSELGLDTITDLSQVDDERFNRMTEIIANHIREIVNNFPVPDSTLPSDAAMVGDTPVEFGDDTEIDKDEYINTLAVAVASNLLNEVLMKNENASLDAYNYGHKGYVSVADENKRTIWLFFYDSLEECNNILTHIKKDIIYEQHETD